MKIKDADKGTNLPLLIDTTKQQVVQKRKELKQKVL
jgi:hypothetical protein